MSYSVKNVSRQPIIGNMGDGGEFRLSVGDSKTVTEKQAEGYIKTLVANGDLSMHSLETRTFDDVKVVKAVEEIPQKNDNKEE